MEPSNSVFYAIIIFRKNFNDRKVPKFVKTDNDNDNDCNKDNIDLDTNHETLFMLKDNLGNASLSRLLRVSKILISLDPSFCE